MIWKELKQRIEAEGIQDDSMLTISSFEVRSIVELKCNVVEFSGLGKVKIEQNKTKVD